MSEDYHNIVYSFAGSAERLIEGFELGDVFFIVQNAKSVMERFMPYVERSGPESMLRRAIEMVRSWSSEIRTILISHRSVLFSEAGYASREQFASVADELSLLFGLDRLMEIEMEADGDEDNRRIVFVVFGSHRYHESLVSMGLDGMILPPDWRCSCVI